MARALFGGLALVDAALLAYLVLNYDWFVSSVHANIESPAAIFLIPLGWAFLLAEKAFFAAYFGLVGTAIVREITGKRDASRWLALLATFVLVPALAVTVFVWILAAGSAIYGPHGFLLDRLTLFDALANNASDYGGLFGTAAYVGGSIGRTLIILLGVVYLSEKYILAWWRVRWPLPLLPIVAIGWVAWSVHDGEQRIRGWVAAQQWRPVGTALSWIDAVGACEQIGDGWRLPRREELARYLSMQPALPAPAPGAAAWTATQGGYADAAIAVDLAPRKSGRWNRNSEFTRDESLCEDRPTQPGYATDWFVRLRPRVCEATHESAYLFTPGIKVAALMSGVVVTYPTAAAICIKPAQPDERIGVRERRGYRDEREVTRVADFRAYMKEQCGLSPERDRVACFAYAPDLPDFEESGDERTMRAFCELRRNGEGCSQYATLMDRHPGAAERAARYRELACKRGYTHDCKAP